MKNSKNFVLVQDSKVSGGFYILSKEENTYPKSDIVGEFHSVEQAQVELESMEYDFYENSWNEYEMI